MKRWLRWTGEQWRRLRACAIRLTVLHPGHWKWASLGILLIPAALVTGYFFAFLGILHPGIWLAAAFFLLGLPLFAGMGVRYGLELLSVIPRRYSWIFFGGVFFVLFLFDYPVPAMIFMVLFLLISGSFLGAGLYNFTGGRWSPLDRPRRILTVLCTFLGAALLGAGTWFLLYPGPGMEEETRWAMKSTYLPGTLEAPDPSLPGPWETDSLTYGWGGDRRPEFGEEAGMISPRVDGHRFLDGWEGISGKLRSRYWRMGPDSLALNGRVWFPVGKGPFPLVLLVHGNHLARDFSDPGYGYLGRHFASHGIIAVSVDQNFLNGAWSDFNKGLQTENDCRAWLLLKHLELWDKWNRTDTCRFSGRVDMDRVVLVGHSRGGEAVSIAACFNRLPFYPDDSDEEFDFGFGIRGIAAIAPVDGQYWPAGVETPVRDVDYFTLHGTMDADLRTFHGIRQMRRVQFTDSTYHFGAALLVHGANHGQFNRSWGIYDTGYPHSLFINRKGIIPAREQEQVARVYLTAFVLQSTGLQTGYLDLFRDARTGRHWLPGRILLAQFRESTSDILCGYEEDLDLTTGTRGVSAIRGENLALWKEARIPLKWNHVRNGGVLLGWNNETDTVPATYRVELDGGTDPAGARFLCFLAGDAQTDPGGREEPEEDPSTQSEPEEDPAMQREPEEDPAMQREPEADPATQREPEEELSTQSEPEDGGSGDGETGPAAEEDPEKEEPQPVDFLVRLEHHNGGSQTFRLGDYLKLQPPLKPRVFKSRMLVDEPESEVMLQYVALPLDSSIVRSVRAVVFEFDGQGKGSVYIDELGFAR